MLGGRALPGRSLPSGRSMAVAVPTRCFSEGQATQATHVTLKKGKCKGLTYQQCLAQQPQYCTWLLRREKSLQLQSSEYRDFFQFLRLRLQAEGDADQSMGMISPVKSSMTNKHSLAGAERPTSLEGRRRFLMSPSPQLRRGDPLISGQWLVNVGKYAGSGNSFEEVYATDTAFCQEVCHQVLHSSFSMSVESRIFALYVLHKDLQNALRRRSGRGHKRHKKESQKCSDGDCSPIKPKLCP